MIILYRGRYAHRYVFIIDIYLYIYISTYIYISISIYKLIYIYVQGAVYAKHTYIYIIYIENVMRVLYLRRE